MKIINIIVKSLKEQIRSHWLLLLSLSMGPFFIFVYFLIMETSKPQYTVLIDNKDKGIMINEKMINHGNDLIGYFKNFKTDTVAFPFTANEVANKSAGIESLKNKTANALIIIDTLFSQSIQKRKLGDSTSLVMLNLLVTCPVQII